MTSKNKYKRLVESEGIDQDVEKKFSSPGVGSLRRILYGDAAEDAESIRILQTNISPTDLNCRAWTDPGMLRVVEEKRLSVIPRIPPPPASKRRRNRRTGNSDDGPTQDATLNAQKSDPNGAIEIHQTTTMEAPGIELAPEDAPNPSIVECALGMDGLVGTGSEDFNDRSSGFTPPIEEPFVIEDWIDELIIEALRNIEASVKLAMG